MPISIGLFLPTAGLSYTQCSPPFFFFFFPLHFSFSSVPTHPPLVADSLSTEQSRTTHLGLGLELKGSRERWLTLRISMLFEPGLLTRRRPADGRPRPCRTVESYPCREVGWGEAIRNPHRNANLDHVGTRQRALVVLPGIQVDSSISMQRWSRNGVEMESRWEPCVLLANELDLIGSPLASHFMSAIGWANQIKSRGTFSPSGPRRRFWAVRPVFSGKKCQARASR